MNAVYCMNWNEYDRGFGVRPDGHTLHASKRAADAYRSAFMANLPLTAPHEYSHPSDPFLVEVSADVAARVEEAGSIWGHVRQHLSPLPTPSGA